MKLIHLVYGLLAAAVCIGVGLGAMQNQQKNNTSTIEKHETKIDANEKILVRIDTRQEVMIKSLDEINKKLP